MQALQFRRGMLALCFGSKVVGIVNSIKVGVEVAHA